MNNTSIKGIVRLKNLIDAPVWAEMKSIEHFRHILKQKYFTDITKTEEAGGILANSENQIVLSLKNLRIQLSKLQEIPKKFIERSCIYTKLALQTFRNNILLTCNLPGNKGFAIGETALEYNY